MNLVEIVKRFVNRGVDFVSASGTRLSHQAHQFEEMSAYQANIIVNEEKTSGGHAQTTKFLGHVLLSNNDYQASASDD